jgi:flagellar biosynthesis protein FlhB
MPEEKRFEATPSRLARARREGDRPHSSDANALASLAAAAFAAACLAAPLGGALRGALVDAAFPALLGPGPYLVAAACVLGVAACGAAGAIAGALLIGGGLAIVAPSIKFAKLAPGPGLKRLFSRDAAFAGVKALLVAAAVGLAAAPSVRDVFARAGSGAGPLETAARAAHAFAGVLASALVVAAAFACADVAIERAKWRRRLRMSFEELKRDQRQNDGDPLLRGRRRQAHRNLVRGAMARVADAAFVVANPTHVAVALEYRPPEVAVPRVLVRALDAGALEVKRRARRLGIPVVEDVALARSLFATSLAGEYIPRSAYAAVAAVVAALARAGARA